MRRKSELLEGTTNVKSSKRIENNTLEIIYEDGSRAIRLHNTDVATFKENKIILNTGGWLTSTTKDRINRFSPLRIHQEKGQWFVKGFVYYDGITFDINGNILSEEKHDRSVEIAKMKKRITKFANLLSENNLPTPNNGDCWFCLLKTKEGVSMGDAASNHSHLESHMEDEYIPGSLLVNAMRESGWADQQIGTHYGIKHVDSFKRALRKYMQKRLIDSIAVK